MATRFGIAQHAEIDEEHGAGEGLEQVMSDRDRDRGLADAAGADDGDEARGGQLRRQLENVVVATDHPGQAAGQVGVRKAGDGRALDVRLAARSRDRRDEAIAPPGQCRDVPCAVLAVAERLAQAGDRETASCFPRR